MKPVLISVDIDRSAAEVFAFLDDVTNNTTWLKGMRSCTLVVEIVESDPSGFYRVMQPLLRMMVARNIRRDYRTLKALLERG